VTGGLEPRWLLVATLLAVVIGIALAMWLFGAMTPA
jgi:hypothetical protein